MVVVVELMLVEMGKLGLLGLILSFCEMMLFLLMMVVPLPMAMLLMIMQLVVTH